MPDLSNIAEILNRSTAEDQAASNLANIASGFKPTDPISAIVGGITGGLALTKKGNAQAKRDVANLKLQELADYEMKLKEYQNKVAMGAAAHQEAVQTGAQLAQGIEQAQLGDESGIKNWLASNPSTQAMLKDRIGVPVESAKITNINGVDVIQAYGRDANGNIVMDPNPVPVDAYLKAYAPDAYAARSAQRLEQTSAQLKNDKLAADAREANANANRAEHPVPVSAGGESSGEPKAKTQKPLSAEAAGKVALVMQGENAVKDIEGLMFDQKGKLNKGLLAQFAGKNIPLVGGVLPNGVTTEGRKLYTALYNMNNAKLRLESGAAVPEEEVKRATDAYIAGLLDDEESAKFKLQAPRQYFSDFKALASGQQPQADLKAKYGLE